MKNIEKYTNTKSALEEYNKLDFKKVPFDRWLDCEYEESCAQTMLEAAEAVIDEWYYTQQNVTLNDLGEKIVDLKKAIARENCKPVLNCVKYKTAKDAFDGFNKMCDGKTCYRCPFSAERNECMSCMLNWLYAVEEKEEAK